MKIIDKKRNLIALEQYRKKYKLQKAFPSFPKPFTDYIIPIRHSAYLMFIRNKFLYFGLLKSLDNKNIYSAYALIKAYWENTAAFGYYYLRIYKMISVGDKESAYKLSIKFGLGGRGFVTEEMSKKVGAKLDDFLLPNILTMMELVDKDWRNKFKVKDSLFQDLYNWQIAEGGHTTFIGINISQRKQKNGSVLPDITKSWNAFEAHSIINLSVLASIIFFYYWEKFQNIK